MENAFKARAHWSLLFFKFENDISKKKYVHIGNDVYYKNAKFQS
jgi:hypothetical protein